MNAREQARFDAVQRVGTFGTNNATDFTTPVPPAVAVSAGQTQAKQLFADLNTPDTGLIADCEERGEPGIWRRHRSQWSDFQGSASQCPVPGAKRDQPPAAAIAEDKGKPDIMDNFRMPYGVGEAVLVAKATAIADVAESMAADFVNYGHEATFADDLRAHIAALRGADTLKETGKQVRAGGTESFEPLLKEAMKRVQQLDAFMHNFYKSNAERMGKWKTASHVERQKKKKDEAPAPAKPNP
jgi:hypothetical protein